MKSPAGHLSTIILLMVSFFFTVSCATQDESQPRPSPNRSERTSSAGNPASGTEGDSLQACLQRIPGDASAGQRMFAERSCERDEADRKSLQSVPGN